MTNESVLAFDLPKNQSSVIKVIGVGGGGSNAVNYMYENGIDGVDFAVCNTDLQALEASPITTKIQIGAEITEGLGAGANPEVGRQAAEESIDRIDELLESNTKMLFITAGMGGGTGTGAAPVIARAAREKGILTVGVVTVPFWTEGGYRKEYAEKGLEELREQVDTLLVINNDRLIEVYGDLTLSQAFAKANEVLNTATKGIAEVISQTLMVNIDLNDAKRVLQNSGSAVMGQAYASGENRAIEAIEAALDSPLLHDNNIKGAQQVLLKIVTGSGEKEIRMTELFSIKKHIQDVAGSDVNIIEGIGVEDGLNDEISVTVIATGFKVNKNIGPAKPITPKVYNLDKDDQATEEEVVPQDTVKQEPQESITQDTFESIFDDNSQVTSEEPQATLNFDLEEESPVLNFTLEEEGTEESPIDFPLATENLQVEESVMATNEVEESDNNDEVVVHNLEMEEEAPEDVISDLKDEVEKEEFTQINHGISAEQMALRSRQRMERLREITVKLRTPSGLTDLESQPAYKRREIELDDVAHSSESDNSSYVLGEDDDKNVGLKPNNFLHDNVD
ncbi:MAG: cell division protein FtsZ [Flavobacteriales bacterium]|jgi:cell division protein FtsZ|nr:cell division protein FtsZ [Flavobacteriales bacterium]|tara:strand:- start:7924 stop:9618 length:1695 start_codon:yes stop_codon:yes gene_type:complete